MNGEVLGYVTWWLQFLLFSVFPAIHTSHSPHLHASQILGVIATSWNFSSKVPTPYSSTTKWQVIQLRGRNRPFTHPWMRLSSGPLFMFLCSFQEDVPSAFELSIV
ncbi:hypothetical protein VNO77_27103 [Canavalia gladiata]|uniref:Secreted protein n=1 Tax=Canavalia gladiata TaxID=3824 RepID=A0AAN9KV56_CANGL